MLNITTLKDNNKEVKAMMNMDYLTTLETALYRLDLPYPKNIRYTVEVAEDGIYFNSDMSGTVVVSVRRDGITMPTIIHNKYGVTFHESERSNYNYDELILETLDNSGPKSVQRAIEELKALAKLV